MMTLTGFADRIERCWSEHSATTYTSANPALGQCSVTALVAQDILGGELLKTRVGSAWHFYNLVGGSRCDFTASQFKQPIAYEDVPSSRDEAFADTSQGQFEALTSAYEKAADHHNR